MYIPLGCLNNLIHTMMIFITLTFLLAACAAAGYLATTEDGKEACKGSNHNARR